MSARAVPCEVPAIKRNSVSCFRHRPLLRSVLVRFISPSRLMGAYALTNIARLLIGVFHPG